MRFWANLVGYQLVWFVIVISASRGQPWLGIAASLVFIVLQTFTSTTRKSDMRALLATFICGFLLDGALVAVGWLHYASPLLSLPAPVWILALWMAFAMTLNHSMAFLRGKTVMAALLGGIGGPLAYLGAARGFNAVIFVAPAWHAIALLAIGWAIALAALAVLTQRWAVESTESTLQPEHMQ
ncbi:DUF2878 domain-containing protein [Thermomonas sp.]|uniref:DUF2878 domain-containing protein n=1 Tax=Thermomonas sp. TaxID=1971895 RepID=UPI0024876021|nr:DUF2878 domain-containing protein [Thermomonas sp.]MDI1253407.1 DUF2878 domain-containing protein [Thermomonas sp.]